MGDYKFEFVQLSRREKLRNRRRYNNASLTKKLKMRNFRIKGVVLKDSSTPRRGE